MMEKMKSTSEEFKPFPKEFLAGLPSNEDWLIYLTTIRMAALMTTKSSHDLAESMARMSVLSAAAGKESLAVRPIEGLEATSDCLKAMLVTTDIALARLSSVGVTR